MAFTALPYCPAGNQAEAQDRDSAADAAAADAEMQDTTEEPTEQIGKQIDDVATGANAALDNSNEDNEVNEEEGGESGEEGQEAEPVAVPGVEEGVMDEGLDQGPGGTRGMLSAVDGADDGLQGV